MSFPRLVSCVPRATLTCRWLEELVQSKGLGVRACGQARVQFGVLLLISWCALLKEDVCDFSHTTSKCVTTAELANCEFQEYVSFKLPI